ncbi:MAG: hypothetical protein JWR20_1489 [Marmoricola sp.]|nr:hypothetical protein [Marmoricola sp.]
MREIVARLGRRLARLARSPEEHRLVLGAGVALVAVQLGLRAWALFPSWFYGDDYILLIRARAGLGPDYLLAPHNGHLMPAGRLLVWLVASSGSLNWGLVATTTLVLQATASAACLWMLVRLFGARWAVLGPLVVYLFGTLTLPALMWWAASLNQLAMQTAFFVAVTAWVQHLRGRGRRWLVLTVAAIVFGLVWDVKALLVLPVLAFLVLAYFSTGRPRVRLFRALRAYWPAAVVLAVVAGAYVAYYVVAVDSPFTPVSAGDVSRTASVMLGTGFVSAAVGGPWRWTAGRFAPNASAAPPDVAVHLAWVVAALVVLHAALRRRRTLRAWGLLAVYLVALLALLVTSRVAAYGADLGLQYRFLTDAACVLTLALGLAHLPLLGAHESSEERAEPVLRVGLPPAATVLVVGLVLVSGVVSTVGYVAYWHHDNPSTAYAHNLEQDLRTQGRVDLADLAVPPGVVDPLVAPVNLLSRFVTLMPNQARFPRATSALDVVDGNGQVRPALVRATLASAPGPEPGCGWRVTSAGLTIPLDARAVDYPWWVRIGYLSSASSPVRVSAGDLSVPTEVRAGLHSLFVRLDGSFSSVQVEGLTSGTTVCVDTVQVGDAVPSEAR